MKKFFCSAFMKALALILCAALAVTAVAMLIGFASGYLSGAESSIYNFEDSFEQSTYFDNMLQLPELEIFNALGDPVQGLTIYGNQGRVEIAAAYAVPMATATPSITDPDGAEEENVISSDKAAELIEKELETLKDHEALLWYVRYDGHVFTNCGAKSPEELFENDFYRMCSFNNHGITEFSHSGSRPMVRYRDSSTLPEGSELTVCAAIREEYAAPIRELWEKQASAMRDFITAIAKLAAALLLLIVYLCLVWGLGRSKDEKRWYGIWTELYLVAGVGIAFVTVFMVFAPLDRFFEGSLPLYLARGIAFTAAGLGLVLTLLCLLELVRKIRLGRFFDDSICFWLVRWCWGLCKRILGFVWRCIRGFFSLLRLARGRKSAHIFLAMLFVYSLVLGLCSIFTPESPMFLILGIALVCFAAFVLIHRAKDLDAIKNALSSIRAGQLRQTLPDIKSDDLKATAKDIEEIAAGLDSALEAQLRSERLKTELITNVSHDLKTPLTSIINYTELLKDMEGLPEEAGDYIAIISSKSDRLKKLTEDLFSISKVQSGAEELNYERLSPAVLIEQAMAERDREIKASPLNFCLDLDRELYILADGRKMSRVLGNLLDNILKYSMDGTRVFITAAKRGDQAVMEFKNISSYLMDFDPEEICGRFVRADDSRSDGGSGLGLAIAKSFTEACGGSFQLITDGDLFKAVISFEAV